MSKIDPVLMQFELNTGLFKNALDDITDKKAGERIGGSTNTLNWIAGHLLSLRMHFAGGFGLAASFKGIHLYIDTTIEPVVSIGFDPRAQYSPIADILSTWSAQAPLLFAVLEELSDDQLLMPLRMATPLGGKRLLEWLTWIGSHETYHIGQMSILRQGLGLQPVSFKIANT